MAGETNETGEFSIGRGREHSADADSMNADRASRASAQQARRGQGEFDLHSRGQGATEGGMPDQLRRKYYVAEAGFGDEAKVYADPKGEYLAFKVTSERMATRLEDAGVIRDMVSIAQHRSWAEVELRGSNEFRRTAWIEASARGLSVRGYEPDPVDRAALAFRSRAAERSSGAPSQPLQTELEASETISVGGVSTRRPIDVTVLPPERGTETRRQREDDPAPFQEQIGSNRSSSWRAGTAEERPAHRPALTIDVVPLRPAASRQYVRSAGQRRAEMFRSGDNRQADGDDVVRAARSQFAAIERALSKAVRDPQLRRSVLAHAKERIAEQLKRGGEFDRVKLHTMEPVRKVDRNVHITLSGNEPKKSLQSERAR